jgi:hypothetical protein
MPRVISSRSHDSKAGFMLKMFEQKSCAWATSSRKAVILIFVACSQFSLLAQQTVVIKSMERSPIPFVGCKSDGQVGPLNAPTGKNKVVSIAPEVARQVAYYKAEQGFGVVAPRGWYCFGTYGSNGNNLYISPQPIDAALLFSDKWAGFTGPAIQLSGESGDTSGRFGVARMIARVFPAYKKFVAQVIAENIEPPNDFPSGPYPEDKLTYKSKSVVEFETPAHADGLGTNSRLKKNTDPINGVVMLMDEAPDSMPDLVFLSVRLPSSLNGLTSAIIQLMKREAQNSVGQQR